MKKHVYEPGLKKTKIEHVPGREISSNKSDEQAYLRTRDIRDYDRVCTRKRNIKS